MLSWGALSKAMWVRQRGNRAVPNRREFIRVKLPFYYYLEKNHEIGRSEIKFFQKFFECGKCGGFMSFRKSQSYKELQADWRWIHSMDPEAAAAADQWVKEHPEE